MIAPNPKSPRSLSRLAASPAGKPLVGERDLPVWESGSRALAEILRSEGSPRIGMGLCELDGFLTGIVAGPEVIPPSEWAPWLWRGVADPVFPEEEAIKTLLDSLLIRFDEITRGIMDETYRPIISEEPGGAHSAADWAKGFALAIGLRPKAWDRLLGSKSHALLLMPIMLIGVDEDFLEPLKLDEESLREALQTAPHILPHCVMGINAFWAEENARRKLGLSSKRLAQGDRTARGPGRNDPCPCGSGRKFKKCCG